MRRRVVAVAIVALLVAACGSEEDAPGLNAVGPDVAPITVAPAATAIADPGPLVTCGGTPPFAASALTERRPVADEALRAALDDADRMLAPDGEYFVAADTDGEALLLRGSPADGYWYVVFDRAEGWRWAGSGTCSLATFRADDAYATWSLPVGEEPAPDATAVTVLVMERACTSGASVEGRMLPPEIDYGPTAVTITIGVVPLGASDGDPDAPPVSQTCQGVQTPVDVRLAEPLGDRKLLDGFWYPPQPPR